jgi:hypothetical protein
MCSRRILRELVMHMLVSTNGVNVYGESTYTKIRERSLTSFSPLGWFLLKKK